MGRKPTKLELHDANAPDMALLWQALYDLLSEQEGWGREVRCQVSIRQPKEDGTR